MARVPGNVLVTRNVMLIRLLEQSSKGKLSETKEGFAQAQKFPLPCSALMERYFDDSNVTHLHPPRLEAITAD